MGVRMLTAVSLALFLSACGVLPVASYDRQELIDDGQKDSVGIERITHEKAFYLASAWRKSLENSASDRRSQELVAEEVLYYGSVVLLGAQTAIARKGSGETISSGLRRTRNAGAVAALLSSLFTQHYKPAEQRPIFERAERRMRCVTDSIADIQPDVYVTWSPSEFAAIVDDSGKSMLDYYLEMPRQIVDFVEQKSVPELRAALNAITLGQPTKEDFEKAVKEWQGSQEDAQAMNKNTQNFPSVTQEVLDARVKKINKSLPDGSKLQPMTLSSEIKNAIDEDRKRFLLALRQLTSHLDACYKLYQQ